MADIIVTTLEDELDAGATVEAPGGNGLSLREAISLSVNGDTISFADDLEGTIRLDDPAGRLVLESDISIFGDSRITISGDVEGLDVLYNGVTDLSQNATENLDDNVQLFYATSDVTSVTLDGLTLTGGRSVAYGGGVIDSFNAELTVTNSVLAGNSSENGLGGGALYGTGAFTIENSTFIGNIATSGNGGAIDARGVATITGSTFSGNQAAGPYGGGAIYSTNTLDIRDSTFDANTSTGGKGGGAVHSRNGGLLAVNTTFYANKALNGDDGSVGSGGAVYTYGGGYLNNVTATGNYSQFQGGGIFGGVESGLSGEGLITNSIILGNKANVLVAGAGNEIDGSLTFVISDEDNISNGDPADVFADTTTITAPNGSTTFTAGVLADNGGQVKTVALNSDPSNPALN